MKITLEDGPHFCFILRSSKGKTRLVQHDTDFPGVARTFGWSGAEETNEAIWSAYEFLQNAVGQTVDDPGYF